MRSRDTRLAVMLATAPASNVIRALAMSTNGVSTGTPTADTERTPPPTNVRTRSMSWIIRSSTTATSEPRGLNGASRSLSMNRGAVDVRQRGAHGAVESLDVTRLHAPPPCARAIASSASASSSVVAIGFSIEHVQPALERRRGDREVRRRRHDDAHRVDVVEQRVERRERLARRAPTLTCSARVGVRRRESRRAARPARRAEFACGGSRARPRRRRRCERPSDRPTRDRCARRTRGTPRSPGYGCSSAAARSRACDRFSSDLKNRRYARLSSRRTSSGNPLRSRPTTLRPYSLIGLPTAFTYGGTSFATREQPPMKLYRPIVANWCTRDEAARGSPSRRSSRGRRAACRSR